MARTTLLAGCYSCYAMPAAELIDALPGAHVSWDRVGWKHSATVYVTYGEALCTFRRNRWVEVDVHDECICVCYARNPMPEVARIVQRLAETADEAALVAVAKAEGLEPAW